jgi:hypothetical protein
MPTSVVFPRFYVTFWAANSTHSRPPTAAHTINFVITLPLRRWPPGCWRPISVRLVSHCHTKRFLLDRDPYGGSLKVIAGIGFGRHGESSRMALKRLFPQEDKGVGELEGQLSSARPPMSRSSSAQAVVIRSGRRSLSPCPTSRYPAQRKSGLPSIPKRPCPDSPVEAASDDGTTVALTFKGADASMRLALPTSPSLH